MPWAVTPKHQNSAVHFPTQCLPPEGPPSPGYIWIKSSYDQGVSRCSSALKSMPAKNWLLMPNISPSVVITASRSAERHSLCWKWVVPSSSAKARHCHGFSLFSWQIVCWFLLVLHEYLGIPVKVCSPVERAAPWPGAAEGRSSPGSSRSLCQGAVMEDLAKRGRCGLEKTYCSGMHRV